MQPSRTVSRFLHRLTATVAVVAAGTVVPLTPVSLTPSPSAAAQQMVPETVQDALTASDLLWANPQARSADPDNGVSAQVTAQSEARVGLDGVLRLTVRVSNGSDQPVSGLELRAQRAAPVDTAAGVATSLLANQGEYPWVGEFVPVGVSVSPGQSREIPVTVPLGDTSGTGEDTPGTPGSTVSLPGLGITTPGVHPLLFNLNGNLGDADTSFLAGARTTVTVDPDATDPDAADPDAAGGGTTPGITVLWPLSSTAVATAGQVGDAPDPAKLYLPDETLAGELSEGGRLRGLLDTWRDASGSGSPVRTSLCLAVDPDLLETVERMTHGYRVGTVVPAPVENPTRLRDSWGHRDRNADSVDGEGAQAAASWLDDLRDAVAESCVVPLPFANADVNAVAAGDDPWLSRELTDRGREAVEEVLGVTPATGVQIPGAGYLESDAVAALSGALSGNGGSPVTAVVADSTLVTDEGSGTEDPADARRSAVDTLEGTDGATVRTLRYPAELGAALAATGSRPETVAYTDPARRRDLAEDGAASRMAAAVAVLDREVEAARTGSGEVLALPPAAWSVDTTDAATFLDAVESHFADGSAVPVSLGDALAAPTGSATLADTPAATDPAPVDDGESRNAAQVAGHLRNLTDIMDDVPNIALTREIYIRPMFDDLLRSLSDTGRRDRSGAADARKRSGARTGLITGLAYDLRSAVSLLPPGNVFTRTSDSSPLLVVARNGLPLPVTVRVNYSAAPGVTLNTPGVQQIPARGSVTLQMTSSIPEDAEQSDLTMFLSTPDNVRISDEVTVRVASVPGLGSGTVAVVVAALVLIFALGWYVRRRRRHSDSSPTDGRVLNDGGRD